MAFDKLKGLAGNVKNAASHYLNQENMDRIVGDVKNAAVDVKNSMTEYLNQDPTERAIAKMQKEKEDHLKKASFILSTDFRQDAAGHKFYIDNNYDAPYNQTQWLKLYEELSTKEDPQALAPMYNAVVVSEGGYLVRRGLEPLYAKVIRFVPGENDEVTHTYAYEPYTYKKNPRPVKRAQTTQYRAPAQTGQPANAPLSIAEKLEIDKAKRAYEDAVSNARNYGDGPRRAIFEGQETRAHAEYMRVLAKYAGRK